MIVILHYVSTKKKGTVSFTSGMIVIMHYVSEGRPIIFGSVIY